MNAQQEQSQALTDIQSIVNKIRRGDLTAFSEFYALLVKKYPDAIGQNDKLVFYGTYELMTTDLTDTDVGIAKLFNHHMFDNEQFSGFFLEEYAIRDGSSLLLDAAIGASVLKNTTHIETLCSDNKADWKKIGQEIQSNESTIKAIEQRDVEGIMKQYPKESAFVEHVFTLYEKGYDLYQLTQLFEAYQIELQQSLSQDPTNAALLEKKEFVDNVLLTLPTLQDSDQKNQAMQRISTFLDKHPPTAPKERSIFQKIAELLIRLISNKTYTTIQEKRRFNAFKFQYQEIKDHLKVAGKQDNLEEAKSTPSLGMDKSSGA